MPWHLTEVGIGIIAAVLLAAIPIVVSLLIAKRDRYERNRVEVAASDVLGLAGAGNRYSVRLQVLNKGNRATVVRDVKLVSTNGEVILSCRFMGARCDPPLPLRLEAPDERTLLIDIAPSEAQSAAEYVTEFLEGTAAVRSPFVFLSGRAEGRSTVTGTLTVTPAESTIQPAAPAIPPTKVGGP